MLRGVFIKVFLLIAISTACFADYIPQKFDIVEVAKNDKNKDFAKKNIKLYGVILSGKVYNSSSKNVIIVPIVKKTNKHKKIDYNLNVIIEKQEYTIFTDKPRSVPKEKLKQSSLLIKQEEKVKIETQFNNIIK